MRLEDFGIPDVDSQDAIDLGAVELVRLTAAPSAIGPFGSSTIEWRVRAPDRPFLFTLKNQLVPQSGSREVRPLDTTTFGLRVSLGPLSKTLGAVTVEVDKSDCVEIEFRRIFEQIRQQLVRAVERDPDTVFRGGPFNPIPPLVRAEAGGIRIGLSLRRLIDDQINPNVNLNMFFRIRLEDGVIVARDVSVNARLSVPVWVWLIPGAIWFVPPLLRDGEREAERQGLLIVEAIAAFLDLITTGDPDKVKRSVRFFEDETSEVVAVTFCGTGTPPVD